MTHHPPRCPAVLRLADHGHPTGIPIPCDLPPHHPGAHEGFTAKPPLLGLRWEELS